MALSVILTGFLVAALKNKGHFRPLQLMILAVIIKIISLLLLASLNLFKIFMKNYIILFLSAFCYGISFFFWPTLSGILTKYLSNEAQGTGFGIVDAYTGLAAIIAPFSFGYLYLTFEYADCPYLVFLLATIFCIISVLIIVIPLKSTLNKQIQIISFDSDEQNEQQENELNNIIEGDDGGDAISLTQHSSYQSSPPKDTNNNKHSSQDSKDTHTAVAI